MAELSVGVIGLGRMGWLHAEHLAGSIRGARLAGAAVDPAHYAALVNQNAFPWRLESSASALFDDPAIDAVVIASPTNVHHKHIIQASRHRQAIFAEKPIADSVALARDAVAAVETAGVPFQIGFQRRFDAGYARAKELIASGAIGEPEMFRGISCDRIPPVSYLRTSGGLFWDLGIHDFDAARFLMNDDIAAVHASGAILVEPDLAQLDDVDHGVVTLRFRRGGIGVIQNAWRAPYGYDIRAEVHGSAGKIVTEVDERIPTRLYAPDGIRSDRHHEFVERFRNAYLAELQAFVDAVKSDQAPTPNATDGLRALEVADAATRSLRLGSWQTLPPPPAS